MRPEGWRAPAGLRAWGGSLRCAAAAPWMAALDGEGGGPVPAPVGAHVRRCLRCQARRAHYRRLVRDLHALGRMEMRPPEDAIGFTLAALAGAPGPPRPRRLLAGVHGRVAAGLTAAGAAGAAAGVGLVLRRGRRRGWAW